MDDSNQQEFYSLAYALAVISSAGYNYARPIVDRNSIDCIIQGTAPATHPFPCIYAQIKSTAIDRMSPQSFTYRLKRKNYDDLRRPVGVPFILIVVVVPRDISKWITASEASLLMRRCGYWLSLRGYPDVNQDLITLTIPRSQQFTVESLQAMMTALERGDEP